MESPPVPVVDTNIWIDLVMVASWRMYVIYFIIFGHMTLPVANSSGLMEHIAGLRVAAILERAVSGISTKGYIDGAWQGP